MWRGGSYNESSSGPEMVPEVIFQVPWGYAFVGGSAPRIFGAVYQFVTNELFSWVFFLVHLIVIGPVL